MHDPAGSCSVGYMLYEIKIRLKSPVVGDTWDHKRQMFVFPREDGAWALDISTKHVWGGLLENAIESLSSPVDPEVIRWPSAILLPKMHLLTVYPKDKRQRPCNHEAIPKNVVLTFTIMIRNTDGERELPHPTEKQLHDIFRFIGAYEGISPFGSSKGYGLFAVQSIRPVGRELVDAGQPS